MIKQPIIQESLDTDRLEHWILTGEVLDLTGKIRKTDYSKNLGRNTRILVDAIKPLKK